MNATPDSEHTWFRKRLPDQLLDLLVDGDRTRFDAHARRCSPCARLLTSALGARADWWDGAGHPPVGALLAWDATAPRARTHDPVRTHVASCESCRRDLEDLRGAAMVSEIALAPVLPGNPGAGRGATIPWRALSAAAAGLVVVAATAVLWPRGPERAPARAPTDTQAPLATLPAPGAPGAPRSPGPAMATLPGRTTAAAVTLASAERGAEAVATPIRIEPGITRVPLTLPMLPVLDGASLEVELRDSGGALVSRQVLAADRALRPGGVVLPTEDLAEGLYLLRVRWTDALAGESSREFPLDVRFSRP